MHLPEVRAPPLQPPASACRHATPLRMQAAQLSFDSLLRGVHYVRVHTAAEQVAACAHLLHDTPPNVRLLSLTTSPLTTHAHPLSIHPHPFSLNPPTPDPSRSNSWC